MHLAQSKTEPRLFTSPFMGEAGRGWAASAVLACLSPTS
jgi:hypothetical protein